MSWFQQHRQLASGSRVAPPFSTAGGGTLAGAAPIAPNMGYQAGAVPPPNTAPPDPMQSLHGGAGATTTTAAPVPNSATPAPSGGLPAGYSMDPVSGGGYTLANYQGPGLMAPNTNSFSGVDPDSFKNSQAYNFIADEGAQAIERSAAAKGTLLTGGTLKDLASFRQGHAATFFDDDFNRRLGLFDRANNTFENNRNFAYNSLSGLSSFGLNAANGQSGAYTNAGNAASQGTLGAADAVNRGAGAVAGSLQDYFARRRAQQAAQTAGVNTSGQIGMGTF